MLRIEKKKKQQEAAARATAEDAARNKNPTSKITYFDLMLENATRKRDRNVFRNFSQKGANNPRKKVKGYRAIHPTTKKLADAATRRAKRNRAAKETTLRNKLRARQL